MSSRRQPMSRWGPPAQPSSSNSNNNTNKNSNTSNTIGNQTQSHAKTFAGPPVRGPQHSHQSHGVHNSNCNYVTPSHHNNHGHSQTHSRPYHSINRGVGRSFFVGRGNSNYGYHSNLNRSSSGGRGSNFNFFSSNQTYSQKNQNSNPSTSPSSSATLSQENTSTPQTFSNPPSNTATTPTAITTSSTTDNNSFEPKHPHGSGSTTASNILGDKCLPSPSTPFITRPSPWYTKPPTALTTNSPVHITSVATGSTNFRGDMAFLHIQNPQNQYQIRHNEEITSPAVPLNTKLKKTTTPSDVTEKSIIQTFPPQGQTNTPNSNTQYAKPQSQLPTYPLPPQHFDNKSKKIANLNGLPASIPSPSRHRLPPSSSFVQHNPPSYLGTNYKKRNLSPERINDVHRHNFPTASSPKRPPSAAHMNHPHNTHHQHTRNMNHNVHNHPVEHSFNKPPSLFSKKSPPFITPSNKFMQNQGTSSAPGDRPSLAMGCSTENNNSSNDNAVLSNNLTSMEGLDKNHALSSGSYFSSASSLHKKKIISSSALHENEDKFHPKHMQQIHFLKRQVESKDPIKRSSFPSPTSPSSRKRYRSCSPPPHHPIYPQLPYHLQSPGASSGNDSQNQKQNPQVQQPPKGENKSLHDSTCKYESSQHCSDVAFTQAQTLQSNTTEPLKNPETRTKDPSLSPTSTITSMSPPPTEPSSYSLVFSRYINAISQMEFAYAKYLYLQKKHETLQEKIAFVKSLPIGEEAFKEELEALKLISPNDIDLGIKKRVSHRSSSESRRRRSGANSSSTSAKLSERHH